MDSIFFLKLGLSFLIGGSWVILATYLADKLGPKVGGLISGLPSTLLFGLFFIAWTQSPEAAVTATFVVPLVGGIGSLFLAIFTATIGRGLITALSISLLSWATLTFVALRLNLQNYPSLFIVYFLLTWLSFMYLEHVAKVRTVKGKKVSYSKKAILLRGVLSGLVIATSVLLGKLGGPVLGGVFALFPAMFTSTLAISYLTHGPQFAGSLAKSALLASMSILVYSVVVRFTYIPLGIIVGTLVSVAASLITAFLIFRLLISKLS